MLKIYPYEAAAFKVKEGSLLSKAELYRIAEADDFKSALIFLKDTCYGKVSLNSENYEKALDDDLNMTYKEFLNNNDSKIGEVLLLKNDYHNLKILIKSELLGKKADESRMKIGTIPKDIIKETYKNETLSQFKNIDAEAVKKAKELFAKTQDSRFIDFEIDKALFRNMKKNAEESGIGFLIKYVSVLADITNIKTMYRILKFNRKRDDFAFVCGGEIDLDFFENAENVDFIKDTRYRSLYSKQASVFEKNCDDFIMNYVKGAKYETLGAESLIGYFLAKEKEVKNLKMILSLKKNGIESSDIKERIREVYE